MDVRWRERVNDPARKLARHCVALWMPPATCDAKSRCRKRLSEFEQVVFCVGKFAVNADTSRQPLLTTPQHSG